MVKFPEAEARFFHNIYVCRKCKRKIKAPHVKVMSGKIRCRYCNSKSFRPVRKK